MLWLEGRTRLQLRSQLQFLAGRRVTRGTGRTGGRHRGQRSLRGGFVTPDQGGEQHYEKQSAEHWGRPESDYGTTGAKSQSDEFGRLQHSPHLFRVGLDHVILGDLWVVAVAVFVLLDDGSPLQHPGVKH